MAPGPQQEPLLLVMFWLLMLPIAAFLLRTACGICAADLPTYRRAALIVLLVGPAAYFTFDFSAYGIVLAQQDVALQLPPGYSYSSWLREPLALKWQAIGLIPGIRYLPVVFAICLAGVLQVILLQVTFRIGVLIFLLEWFLNVMAMALLSFLLSLTQGFLGKTLSTDTAPGDSALKQLVPDTQPQAKHAGPRPRDPQRPHARPVSGKGKTPEAPKEGTAAAFATLREGLESTKSNLSPQLQSLKEHLEGFRERFEPYLEPIKEECEPFTQHLPDAVQEFLRDGGWWLVLGGVAVIALIWLRLTLKRLYRALFHKKKKKKWVSELQENLAVISQAYTDPGPKQITVKALPARLRLMIMAPAGKDVGDLEPEMADKLLDWIKPGMGAITSYDHPKVKVWERQYSSGGFPMAFHQHVQIPEGKKRRSNWVLLAGTISMGRQKVHVGMAFHADEPNNIRSVTIKDEQWLDVLGMKDVVE